MADAGLLLTVDSYTIQQSDLTNQLSDIMTSITRASQESTSILQKTSDERAAVAKKDTVGSDQYNADMGAIDDEYKVKLAEVNEWETELENQKEELQTQIEAISAYKDSFQAALKQNVQSDYKFGGSGSS